MLHTITILHKAIFVTTCAVGSGGSTDCTDTQIEQPPVIVAVCTPTAFPACVFQQVNSGQSVDVSFDPDFSYIVIKK